MATYQEIAGIKSDPLWNGLQSKIRVACVKKAADIIDNGASTAPQLEWAKQCIENPISVSNGVENYVVAANSGATVAQILGATDTAIQTNVDAAVDALAV